LTKPNLFQGLLFLEITRAPPWCFPHKIQSCLLPRLCPPINNPPKFKLLLSCQTILSAWWHFPGSTSSLFRTSLLHVFYLLLRGLVLFIPDSLPPILLSEHAVLSSSFAIVGITSVQLECSHCSLHNTIQGNPQSQEIKSTMRMTVGQLCH
jgi:hypothetical protein